VMERARAGDESNLSVSEIMDMVATIATYKFVNLSRAESAIPNSNFDKW
jgi:hypothetical protein